MNEVHDESVLSLKIKDFNEEVYFKLASMEKLCYDEPEYDEEPGAVKGDVSLYKEAWGKINAAWLGYFSGINVSSKEAKEFISGLYSFISIHVGFGGGSPSILSRSDSKEVYNLNGIINETLELSIDHFNDMFIPAPPLAGGEGAGPPPEPTPPFSAKTDAYIAKINSSIDADKSKFIKLYEDDYPDVVSTHCLNAAFNDVPPPDVVMTKGDIWDMIFIELGWKGVFDMMGLSSVIPERAK